MLHSVSWLKSASDAVLQSEKDKVMKMYCIARDNNDMETLPILEMAMDDIDEELVERFSRSFEIKASAGAMNIHS